MARWRRSLRWRSRRTRRRSSWCCVRPGCASAPRGLVARARMTTSRGCPRCRCLWRTGRAPPLPFSTCPIGLGPVRPVSVGLAVLAHPSFRRARSHLQALWPNGEDGLQLRLYLQPPVFILFPYYATQTIQLTSSHQVCDDDQISGTTRRLLVRWRVAGAVVRRMRRMRAS